MKLPLRASALPFLLSVSTLGTFVVACSSGDDVIPDMTDAAQDDDSDIDSPMDGGTKDASDRDSAKDAATDTSKPDSGPLTPPPWTAQFGTSGADYARRATFDAAGNILVGGGTQGAFPGATNAGDYDAFVAKLDAAGTVLWTRQLGTPGSDVVFALATDASGNIYAVGSVNGALPSQTAPGFVDGFIRKYDSAGNTLWTKQIGTASSDSVFGASVDSNGNLLIVGETAGALTGTKTAKEFDAFLQKYDPAGTLLFTRQFGAAGSGGTDQGVDVTVDGTGNIYVVGGTTGAFAGETARGGTDVFLRKLDSSGTELWTKQFGTTGDDFVGDVTTDASGNVYFTGQTNAAFAGQTYAGGRDAFLVKVDGNGNAIFTKEFGTSARDYGTHLFSNANGSISVVGTAGAGLAPQGPVGTFVATFDATGKLLTIGQKATGGDGWLIGANGCVITPTDSFSALPGKPTAGDLDAVVTRYCF